MRSGFSSIRAEALIQAKTDLNKIELVSQDFSQFVEKMRGNIFGRILEAKEKARKVIMAREVVKRWRIFILEEEKEIREK